MTGFAALDIPGTSGRPGRRWELRSVNARGLDLRPRLPEVAGLEVLVRAKVAAAAVRGNVSISLRLGTSEGDAVPAVDERALGAALGALVQVETRAAETGAGLAPSKAADLLALRGVFEAKDAPAMPDLDACAEDLDRLIEEWTAMRRAEGESLRRAGEAHLDAIDRQVEAAEALGPARAAYQSRTIRDALARIEAIEVDADRVAQEVAMLAIRGDVTEEVDRLRAHLAAARELLAADGPVGRRLDFLTQEFNREANTLCAKAQMTELTTVGVDMKSSIDRLREQVQNVE
jgi:uncharacterized protein (TIGR00255 family)